MKVIQLREQLLENTILPKSDIDILLPFMEERDEVVFSVKRGRDENAKCLSLYRKEDKVTATSSYFVGVDWVHENEVAIKVNPKMNDGCEIDYIKMLNEALCEPDNYEHLSELVSIKFNRPSIPINQQQDMLSIFLVTEYINILYRIVRKGLKKSYYIIEENLKNKLKGRILIGENIRRNLTKGKVASNFCRYQVYDIDYPVNRLLKKALHFCIKQLSVYHHSIDIAPLWNKIRYIEPYFVRVGENISIKEITTLRQNPVYKEYSQASRFAQLLLRRYSYDITNIGKKEILTPPFWVDMSKLFELYIYKRLKQIFSSKNEIIYHLKANHQELDYLLNTKGWSEPYVIDAKYKPRYKGKGGISIEDAREVSGYARLSSIYKKLELDENIALPIKCLIIFPDQEADDSFKFTRLQEPTFESIHGYVRMYKVGIKLPVI
ncbi:MAG: hypothetical protein HDR98_11120 [Bacteroides sp.]|nr:hypothetical protein [Bacteroides sp.]